MFKHLQVLAATAYGLVAAPSSAAGFRADFVQSFCSNDVPFVVVNLTIDPADLGRPGLVYVATSDEGKTEARYSTAGQRSWYPYLGEAMYVPYAVVGSLQNAAITVPAGPSGWNLWVGYGALSARDEAGLRAAASTAAKAQEQGRRVAMVDLDHYRRALAQENMKRQGNYMQVAQWNANTIASCNSN